MILELFGSPGAGKTYIINQIHPGAIKEEKSKSDHLADPIKKGIKACISLTPYAARIRRTIRKCLEECEIAPPKYKPVTINDFIWNISMLGSVYKLSKGNVYMDEGVVHRVISMCINYEINKERCCKIIESLSYVIKDVKVIFLNVSKDDCLKSIIKRDRHKYSIDELEGEILNTFLSSYEEYCYCVSDTFKFEQINRDIILDFDFSSCGRNM